MNGRQLIVEFELQSQTYHVLEDLLSCHVMRLVASLAVQRNGIDIGRLEWLQSARIEESALRSQHSRLVMLQMLVRQYTTRVRSLSLAMTTLFVFLVL